MERECEISLCHPSDTGGDVVMGSLKANIMPWIAQGSFAGDLELKDAMFQPVGQITLNVKFERNTVRPPGAKGGDGASVLGGGFGKASVAPGGPNASVAPQQTLFTDDEIKEAFIQFDLDKNGFVGAAEIRHILVNIGESVTDDEVDEMVHMIDRDGDGMISFPEFYKLVSGGKDMPPALWTGPGTNKGGAAGPNGGAKAAAMGSSSMSAIAQAAEKMDGPAAAALRNNKRSAVEELVRRYNVSAETVRRAWGEFESMGKTQDTVDYAAFCDMLGMEPSATVEKVFNLFDGIGDEQHRTGTVNFREFVVVLMNFTPATKEEKTKFSFNCCDLNGDGKITREELTRILKSNHMALSEKEVERKAETIVAQADTNSDGNISLDEFEKVTQRFPNIIYPSYVVAASKMIK
jgi:serine/threonine-protein phosphatase 2B regulatory subunit